ncbi:MAG: thioredoxin family protein [Oscillospiraceae bacterium]|nr:thioredoxin family protein [Oscillospiraceae bacterium]
MKEVLMMLLSDCPYCHRANRMLDKLQQENPAYADIPIRRVDEAVEVDFANSLDYYYVPTFFVDGVKRMEGVPSEEKLRAVLDAALDA